MNIDCSNKQVVPSDAYEVFNIWMAPANNDHETGGIMSSNWAAQAYAHVTQREAYDWSLKFVKSGYEVMFNGLNDAYDRYSGFAFNTGQRIRDDEGRPLRTDDNPILRVALAFAANPELFKLIIDEDADGMLFVELTNKMSDRFTFTILEDYEIFWAFHAWQADKYKANAKAAKQASADRFLARL
jgi:hypothetical protein